MSEHDEPRAARPRVKVTDKRRFAKTDETAPAMEAGAVSGAPSEKEAAGADVEAVRKQAAEYLDHLRRLQAEFDNYRKRVLKEQTQAIELAAEPVIRRLLEVVDDFELALMAATDKPDFDRFLHGVELVYAKLIDSLRAEGLQRIQAEGKPFDPELHEALMQTGDGDGEPVVADVLRPGYTLKGRVVRPAGVRVERT
ncbi:MAG: nucleotide exchange factor GrpE [Actinobacteria bacterium]|nr:nucleotide exchange factor GrpE [Actinomycetota bacterium]